MILVAKSFVSANIGRARRVSSRDKVAGSRSCALSAGHSSGTLARHYSFLQPSFRLTRYPIGGFELVSTFSIVPSGYSASTDHLSRSHAKDGLTIATPAGSPRVPTGPTRQARIR